MPLENATHIKDLVPANPAASDGLNQADDHLRMIKQCLLNDLGTVITNTGTLTVAGGTASVPAYGFASEPTLGLYRPSAGHIAFTGSLTGQGAVEIGTVSMFAGPDVKMPAGYLSCDGQAVSRTTYAALFTAIGTTWGAGDGSTTFNVPNLQDRFPRHRSGSAAGATGTKQADTVKAHTHGVSGGTSTETALHSHSFSGTTGTTSTGGAFSAIMPNARLFGNLQTFTSGQAIAGIQLNNGTDNSIVSNGNMDHVHSFSGTTGTESAAHTHSFSVTSAANSSDTETRPMSATLMFIIRAL